MELRSFVLSYPPDREELEQFLSSRGLAADADIDYAVALCEGPNIAGVGALAGYVLKDIAVAEAYEGTGVASAVVSHLLAEEMRRGVSHLFVFTRPESERAFSSFGFTVVERVENRVVLLENRPAALAEYLAGLGTPAPGERTTGSVVVNCNPFTLGHRHLIRTAASACDELHVFVVDEDRSLFPAATRFQLVREGVRDLPNVTVHHGGKYIISSATFPSYFLREPGQIVETHARLDLTIFGRKIAPALGITRRFVGEEPYDQVTGIYNRIMKQMLAGFGIEVTEIPRLAHAGAPISASSVRKAIKENDLSLAKALVPPSTYEFLLSPEAKPILQRITLSTARH